MKSLYLYLLEDDFHRPLGNVVLFRLFPGKILHRDRHPTFDCGVCGNLPKSSLQYITKSAELLDSWSFPNSAEIKPVEMPASYVAYPRTYTLKRSLS